MNHQKLKEKRRLRRRHHVRRNIVGTPERPRLTVFRSSKHIYAQLIDDLAGTTLAAASSQTPDLRDQMKYGGNVKAAKVVGQKLAEAARAKRIQIVPVAASGVGDVAEYAMRAMAAATQSRYIFLTDDSGIGNPHATPAVDCFLVTRLDRLVRRVLDSQISGRRVEPREGEVIRSVGQYEGGKCVLPPDYRRWEQ